MATSSKIATLMSDHERYTTTFAEYCKRSKKYDILKNWIETSFPEKVVNSINAKETAEINMLGVGSGSGLVETFALKQLLTKWSKVNHTVIEPNSDLIGQFKNLAANEKNNLSGVTFNWNQKTLEEFRRENPNQTKEYHLIMAIQTLYYVDDVEDVVKYLTSILADGGILVILVTGENSCFWRIPEKYPQLRSEIQHAIFSEHIEKMVTANSNKCQTIQIDAKIDSTGCFDEDSKEGELIIDFITQVAYLKKQTSEAFYKQIIDFIKSDKISLPTTEDGKSWFRNKFDIIYVTK